MDLRPSLKCSLLLLWDGRESGAMWDGNVAGNWMQGPGASRSREILSPVAVWRMDFQAQDCVAQKERLDMQTETQNPSLVPSPVALFDLDVHHPHQHQMHRPLACVSEIELDSASLTELCWLPGSSQTEPKSLSRTWVVQTLGPHSHTLPRPHC